MKYTHTNLVAKDWKRVSAFYQEVLCCTPIPPQKHKSGEWISRLVGLEGVTIEGEFLRLPGYGEDGPTLEIFTYNPSGEAGIKAANSFGFAHLAFEVDDVQATMRRFFAAGGSQLGDIMEAPTADGKTMTVVYAQDVEGNVIELQSFR